MDLDTATDELYAISPDDFVERRKALAAGARRDGDRELSKQITALRRPTRSAWLVNVLARDAADDVGGLLDLGGELADAQQRGSGADLRRLSQQRRKAVDALAARAVKLGQDLGYAAPDGALQEVAQTLQAALGEPAIGELVRRGCLTQATTYGGFGPSDLTSALAASMPAGNPAGKPAGAAAARLAAPPDEAAATEPESEEAVSAEPEPEEAAAPEVSEEERRRREETEQAAADARAAADEAQAQLRQAETESEAATAEADRLAEQVDDLRSRLRETEAAEREAREQARALRKRLTEHRQAAAAAEHAAKDAAEELA